jgi:tRNA dimethylallyltransferase
MPASDAATRSALDAEAAARGWPALHAELAQVDPVTAARLAPLDAQRIQRALEVWRISGQPLSSFHTGRADRPVPPPLLSLEPGDRAWLHQRIAQRFAQMETAGLLSEVATLRARGDLTLHTTSMRCVGYRQVWEALDAQAAAVPDPLLLDWQPRGIAATRQLAKRQITWLRSMPWRQVIACDAPEAQAHTVAAALALLPQLDRPQ